MECLWLIVALAVVLLAGITLAAVLLLISIVIQLRQNQRRLLSIMSAIDNLREAVNNNATTAADGFAAIASALEELATDIQNLPQNADVEAEATRLAGVTSSIAEHTTTFAQQIRDAIETPPPPPE